MSYFLSTLLHFNDKQDIKKVEIFLGYSRPLFIEDVDPSLQKWFSVFENIEFASNYSVDESDMLIYWYNKPEMTFESLKPLLNQTHDVSLVLAYQIDAYADCSDEPEEDMDGVFIYSEKQTFKAIRREQASTLFSNELVAKVSKIIGE